MFYRYMTNEDYPIICKWWKDNRFPVQRMEDLPMVNGELQGVVVYNETDLLCAGFIIETTIRTGVMIEYIVANFDIKDRKIRKDSQVFLLKSMVETAKAMGKKFAFSSLKNPGLVERYKDSGFKITSENTCEMFIGV